jgi:hypothetical protein
LEDRTLLIIILGLVAVGICGQAVALLGALRALQRLEIRIEGAERELRALKPRLERVGQIIENIGAWTDAVTEHLPRVTKGLETTLDGLGGIARIGATVLLKPLRPLGAALALWQGLKSGASVLRQVRSGRRTRALDPAGLVEDSS